MNIRKTNFLGVKLIESRFKMFKEVKHSLIKEYDIKGNIILDDADSFWIRTTVFDYHKNQKVLRLSKNIVKNCKLINVQSIKENIILDDFDFESLVILLENDSAGIIKIDRIGADFDFVYLKDLNNVKTASFDTYSFLTKEFNINMNVEHSNFVVQILAYLYYGDITTKFLIPKAKTKINSFSYFSNNTKIPITYVDSLWKQRISVDGFQVRGHFRMQPYGEGRTKRKLIWIEEFSKEGYNRRATKEIDNES